MNYIDIFKELITINPKSKNSLMHLMKIYSDCLNGLSPEKFYISSVAPGSGKSLSVKTFLAVKKAEGFKGDESVLIVFKTISEVKDFIEKDCPVDKSDIALLTSDDIVNSLGSIPSQSRVLVSTHERLKRSLEKKKFNKAVELFYKGKPRRLRICDEALAPAEAIHIRMDDIVNLFAPLRFHYREWVEDCDEFVKSVKLVAEGAVITVPASFGTGRQFRHSDKLPVSLSGRQRDTAKAMLRAAGRRLRVCNLGGDKVLVGAGSSLPSDLAPLIILDASARVKEDYRLWGKHRRNVEILTPTVVDYGNLTVRIWQQGCGATVLSDEGRRGKILRNIAKAINAKQDERWLVIMPKGEGETSIPMLLPGDLDQPGNVSYLHWGRHYGTNEYAGVRNVVVVGGFLAPETTYLADFAAASGIKPEYLTDDQRRLMKSSKLKDNLLQAFCRGNIRSASNDICGECTVHLILPSSLNPETLVRETFPGCRIEQWERPALKGQAKAVFDILKELQDSGRWGAVCKAEIRKKAGIGSPSRLSQILTKEFIARLVDIGIETENKEFYISAI